MILNIKKPNGITSHDVVDKVRRITGEQRVGHAGTLDPFATGVLIVAVGREDTKKLGEITKNTEKEYIATVEFGKTSTTGDPEGEIKEMGDTKKVTEKDLKKVLDQFIGEITQTSPAYSAVRVQGVRAHKLARQGKNVQMPKRIVSVYGIELLHFELPFAKLKITCSSGTYIRTLVEDIGKALGVGAYTKELTRTRVGEYKIEDSTKLEDLSQEFLLKNK